MYRLTSSTYFCCEPGQYGVLPNKGYSGICLPLDQAVASSMIATTASQAGGGAVVTVSASANAPLSTKTVTSTMAGGSVTLVTTTIGAAATTGSSGSSGSNGNGNTNSSNGGSNGGLSLGAKIGIAVGAAALFLAAAFFAWRWRRSSKLLKEQELRLTQNQGQAPVYSVVSPQVQEYKTPAVGMQTTSYASPTPPPATEGLSHGEQYPAAQPPVEVPASRWERRWEMGDGR
jgi:hypothetical protein